MTLWKWSQTAASNANADATINFAEGQTPGSVNNSARALMAAVAKGRDDWSGLLNTGGSSTAYTITSNQGLTALTDGFRIAARAHTASGASPTLAVDGLTAKAIRTHTSTALPSGALNSGGIYSFTYDSGDDCWYVHDFYSVSVSEYADDVFRIQDNADATKELAFQCSGITTGNTRTLTIPDANGTVLLDGDIGTSVQAHDDGLDDIAALAVTKGNLIVGDGSNFAALGVGNDDQLIAADSGETTGLKYINSPAIVPVTPQATTSGTAIDFTSIPTGVRRITIIFDDVDTAASANFLVQIGDSGGIATSGYESSSAIRGGTSVEGTSGFIVNHSSGSDMFGQMTLYRIGTSHRWIASHTLGDYPQDQQAYGGGGKTLSNELDRIRVTVDASAFSSGQISIDYQRV